jgi:hypothetical protein
MMLGTTSIVGDSAALGEDANGERIDKLSSF